MIDREALEEVRSKVQPLLDVFFLGRTDEYHGDRYDDAQQDFYTRIILETTAALLENGLSRDRVYDLGLVFDPDDRSTEVFLDHVHEA